MDALVGGNRGSRKGIPFFKEVRKISSKFWFPNGLAFSSIVKKLLSKVVMVDLLKLFSIVIVSVM